MTIRLRKPSPSDSVSTPGIVGEREVDFASRGRGQRPKRHRRAPAQGLIGRRLGPLLELVCASLLEAVAVEVHRAVLREPPVQHTVAKILEGIEASPAGGG